jgi:hypothetical protein
MKKKKKINISISKDIIEKLNELATNKSRYIEYALVEYLKSQGINIKDIIL